MAATPRFSSAPAAPSASPSSVNAESAWVHSAVAVSKSPSSHAAKTERVAGTGHATALTERLELGEGLRLQFPGAGVPALLPGDAAQRRQNHGDAPPVAEFAVERQCALQPAHRRRVLALQVREHAAALQRLRPHLGGRPAGTASAQSSQSLPSR